MLIAEKRRKMKDTKLIQLIKRLDKTEKRAFSKFLNSPYHNSNKKLIILWQAIKSKAPDYYFKAIEIKRLYKKLYKGEVYDEKKLRQLRFLLLRLLEEFLAIERFKKDDFRFNKEIVDVYLDKEMKAGFEKKHQELHKSFDSKLLPSSLELYQKMSLHHQAYFNELYVKGDKTSNDLKACTKLLEQYYTHQKLLYTVEWLSRRNPYASNIPSSVLEYSNNLSDLVQLTDSPTISLLKQAIKLFLVKDKETDEVFNIMISQFEDNYPHIHKNDKNLILRLLLNYCISKLDNGANRVEDMFRLYSLGLRDEAIFYKGLMSNITFINVISTALKLQKIKWIADFIKKEKHRLYENQNELYLKLGKAIVAFYKKEYQDCLELLSSMDSSKLSTIEIAKRGLKLRAIFECSLNNQSYTKMIYSNIESYMKFIKRRTILSNKKSQSYLNFAKCLLRFVKWRDNKGSYSTLILIKKLLLKPQPFPASYKIWLLKHVEQHEIIMGLHEQPQISSR